MPYEDAVLEGPMGNLGEASGRIRVSRRLLVEHALMDEPRYLRLAARLSEALDATETASREARRRRSHNGGHRYHAQEDPQYQSAAHDPP